MGDCPDSGYYCCVPFFFFGSVGVCLSLPGNVSDYVNRMKEQKCGLFVVEYSRWRESQVKQRGHVMHVYDTMCYN